VAAILSGKLFGGIVIDGQCCPCDYKQGQAMRQGRVYYE